MNVYKQLYFFCNFILKKLQEGLTHSVNCYNGFSFRMEKKDEKMVKINFNSLI